MCVSCVFYCSMFFCFSREMFYYSFFGSWGVFPLRVFSFFCDRFQYLCFVSSWPLIVTTCNVFLISLSRPFLLRAVIFLRGRVYNKSFLCYCFVRGRFTACLFCLHFLWPLLQPVLFFTWPFFQATFFLSSFFNFPALFWFLLVYI